MSDEKTQILCTKSLTVTDLYPDGNIQDDTLKVGFDGKNIYRSYLYFDIGNILENSIINFVILRIFIKKIVTCHTPITLYVQALKDEFNKCTTFNNQPEYNKIQIKINVNSDLRGWLDINITNLFCNCSDISENKGIIIRSNDWEKSLINFASNLTCNPAIIPRLYMDYSCIHHKSNDKYINVIEKYWELEISANTETYSPAVNVERIIQGTFFVYNTGSTDVLGTVQVSVDSINWVNDWQDNINANSSNVLIAQYYGKYYRLKLESSAPVVVQIKFIYQIYR